MYTTALRKPLSTKPTSPPGCRPRGHHYDFLSNVYCVQRVATAARYIVGRMHMTTLGPGRTSILPQSYPLPPTPNAGQVRAAAGAGTGSTAAPPGWRGARQSIAVLAAASLLGLWLGVAAPDVSPAAPPAANSSAAPPAAVA